MLRGPMRLRALRQSLRRPALRAESAQLAAWCTLAVVSLIHAHADPAQKVRPAVALARDLFVAGHLVAAGVLVAFALALWRRFGPRRPWLGYLAVALGALLLTAPVLREDLSVRAGKLPLPHLPALVLLVVAVSAVIPCAALLGRLLARPWLHLLGFAAALALAVANHLVLPDDYPGVHLVAALAAATLLGAAETVRAAPPGRRRARRGRLALALAGALSLLVHPANSTSLAVQRVPGDVVAPWLARYREREDVAVDLGDAHPSIVPAVRDGWYQSRLGRPALPPASAPLLPRNAVVIFFVVDCLRADLLDGDLRAGDLPHLTALRRAGTQFKLARSTAPATSSSVSAILSGRYYSQLYWSQWPGATAEWVYPHLDPTPRLPDLLGKAGVDTVIISGMPGLVNAYGVVHGFAEETVIKGKTRLYPEAFDLMTAVLARVSAQPAGRPLFLYVHFTDAHAPYDHGSTQGLPFDRYLRGVKRTDAELGRLLARLDGDPALRDRAAVFVTADHGEGFGEHGSSFHATNVYDELLRVPLLVRLPGAAPHVTSRPVSLIDLVPTVLDLFGQPIPGELMGQSLTPFFRGEEPAPTRPIAADSSRLVRALIFPDNKKIIHDRRRGTVELYDLAVDPRERRDLFDQSGADGEARLRALKAFFHAHTLPRPGYVVPYGR
jgi:hypothetical protein